MSMSRRPRGAVAGMFALLRDARAVPRETATRCVLPTSPLAIRLQQLTGSHRQGESIAPSSIAAINGHRDRRTMCVTDRRHIH